MRARSDRSSSSVGPRASGRVCARALASLGLLAACALPAACSTSSASSSPDASIGASQPVGAPCDESLPNACAPLDDAGACFVDTCLAGVCRVTPVSAASGASCGDAGSSLPPTNALCATDADCDGGACAYYAAGGCATAGVCVAPLSGSLPAPACGCDGLPDPYVGDGFTARPASSPGACTDGGEDDGGEDAALDGATDGGPTDGAVTEAGVGDGGAVVEAGVGDATPE